MALCWFFVGKGSASIAIDRLLKNGKNQVYCEKLSTLVILDGQFDFLRQMKSKAISNIERARLDDILRGQVIPSSLPNDGDGLVINVIEKSDGFDISELIAGDQVWFKNPYYVEGDSPQGEDGSNVFYVSEGWVMSLYEEDGDHRCYRLETYARDYMSGFESINGKDLSKIKIERIRRPLEPFPDSIK